MYARAAAKPRPRTSQMASFPAPKAGWISNRNYSQPNEGQSQYGAFVLDNFFPTAQGAIMRRGSELYATLGDGSKPVTSLFSYKNGNIEKLFGAIDTTIYDITIISAAQNFVIASNTDDVLVTDTGDMFGSFSTLGSLEALEGLTDGNWVVTQFATSGGVFLVGVNGVDSMFIYDGTRFYPIAGTDVYTLAYDGGTAVFSIGQTITGGTSGATGHIVSIDGDEISGTLVIDTLSGTFQDNEALTDGAGGAAVANGTQTAAFPGVTGVDTSKFNYVWSYKNRLYFVEKDAMNVWYLDLDSVSGTATQFPMGGIFNLGGSILFGERWSLESGDGLSNQWLVVTTQGEIAVYSGLFPGDTAWSQVGVYRTGLPLGKRAHIRAGGDLVIATDIGFIPVSASIQRDYGALAPSAISYAIEDQWGKAVERRSGAKWECELWPTAKMAAVALPTVNGESAIWFVANIRTGGWGRYTNWDATCMEVFQSQLYFGSQEGRVVLANVSGADEGDAYTASFIPLFDDLKSPATLKIPRLARAAIRSQVAVKPKISVQADFSEKLPAPPPASTVLATDGWGTAVWGESVWGEEVSPITFQQWQSVSGRGYALAAAMQITSGATTPLDVELVRTDLTYDLGDIVT